MCYLPEVLRYIILEFALHQMAKQRLDLIENTLFWLLCVILNGQESLEKTLILQSQTLVSLLQTSHRLW